MKDGRQEMGPEADLISTQVQKTKLLKEPDTLQMSFFLSPPLLRFFSYPLF